MGEYYILLQLDRRPPFLAAFRLRTIFDLRPIGDLSVSTLEMSALDGIRIPLPGACLVPSMDFKTILFNEYF